MRIGAPRLVNAHHAVEWAEPGRLLVSRGNRLYACDAPGTRLNFVMEFPVSWWSRLAMITRPGQRLLRQCYYNVVPTNGNELFITFGRDLALHHAGRVHPLRGIQRPTRVLRGACAVVESGDIYFGEYIRRTPGTPTRIYRLPADSDRVETAYEFAPDEIKHVHGIYRDPYDGSLWCLTGDVGAECRMLRSRDGFRTVETVGSGDESWRAISISFTRDAVYYGTDAEYAQNRIFALDRVTHERRAIAEVGGPVYYACTVDDHVFMGVSAELCPSQRDRLATLWHVRGDHASSIFSLEKDILPVRLGMPGSLEFPAGPGLPRTLLLRGTALRGLDGQTYAFDVGTIGQQALTQRRPMTRFEPPVRHPLAS